MDPTNNFLDNPMDISASDSTALMDLDFESKFVMVDPQLTMLYSGHHSDKPSDTFSVDASIWDTQLDNSMALFEGLVQHHGDGQATAVAEDLEAPSSAANSASRRTSKTSRTSSKSSVPSLASIHSHPKKRVRKPSRKKQEQQPMVVKKESVSGGEDDPKRTKYLERNRVAASKCRQKKKEWVHDLDETKAELESKHTNLQREYSVLLDEVSKMKNYLMTHAGCNDQNIDQWIEIEARKFVQKTTHRSEGIRSFSASHSASASVSRRPSLAGM
jgi:hypothetical protein